MRLGKVRSWHKWVSLLVTLFVLLFATSGIILNHRYSLRQIDLSRALLPENYHFKNWNNNALKGSLAWGDSLLLYGNAGIYLVGLADSLPQPFDLGLPQPSQEREILRMGLSPEGSPFAISTYHTYRYQQPLGWQELPLPLDKEERLTDLLFKGDSLFILSRNEILLSLPPYRHFRKFTPKHPTDSRPTVSLLRTIWTLHSGEMFSLIGKLLVDLLALILALIALSGLAFTLLRPLAKRSRRSKAPKTTAKKGMKWMLGLHNKLGVASLGFLLFITLTGMFLRPPLIIALMQGKLPALPYSSFDSPNPWQDKLRMLRYDQYHRYWLLYTSDGLYKLEQADGFAKPIECPPPINLMGLTVLEPQDKAVLVGSLTGLYLWQAEKGKSIDWFSGEAVAPSSPYSPPKFHHMISGVLQKDGQTYPIYYDKGLPVEAKLWQPATLGTGRISLWQLALEVHTGRIWEFLLGRWYVLYIFLSGAAILLSILTGYRAYRRYHKRRKR